MVSFVRGGYLRKGQALAALLEALLDRLLLSFGLSSAERRDSVVRYLRSNFGVWVIDGVEYPDTPDARARLKPGSLLKSFTVRSKCDSDNSEWGGRAMWFAYDPANILSFAYWWSLWQRHFPAAPSAPAFSPSGDGRAFTLEQFSERFNQQLVDALGAAAAAMRSYHSCRVTFASLMLKLKYSDGTIQALCRWKTVEAMRIYARLGATEYSSLVEKALEGSLDLSEQPAMPPTGPEDAAQELAHALHELGRDVPSDLAPKQTRGPRPRSGALDTALPTRNTRSGAGSSAQQSSATPEHMESVEPDLHTPVRYELDDGVVVHSIGADSWGLVGLSERIADFIWPDFARSRTRTMCDIVAFVGDAATDSEAEQTPTYLIRTHESDQYASELYLVSAATLRAALPPSHHKRLGKYKAPKALQSLSAVPPVEATSEA